MASSQIASKFDTDVIITFNQDLDQLLGGGIITGRITEIFGEKGAGKTTLCMQICITVQLPRRIQGLESEAIFIDTEQTFTNTRLKDMVYGCVRHCEAIKGLNSSIRAEDLLQGIHHLVCSNVEDFGRILAELDYYLHVHARVKLIVVDSLAFLYYTNDSTSEKAKTWMARTQSLYYFAQQFNILIQKYNLAVVVTNNVTTRFEPNGEKYEIPFLGPSWPYVPHVRLQLKKCKQSRQAHLFKHFRGIPTPSTTDFSIKTAGIR